MAVSKLLADIFGGKGVGEGGNYPTTIFDDS